MYIYNFFAAAVLASAGRMGETMAPSTHSGRGAAGLGSRVEVAKPQGKLCVARRAGGVLLTLGFTYVYIYIFVLRCRCEKGTPMDAKIEVKSIKHPGGAAEGL